MLTLQALQQMPPETIFAQGEVANSEHGIFMERGHEGRMLRWIARRGGIHDWAIYCLWADNSTWDTVSENGDKMTSERNIRSLVECDDEAFKMYRK